MNKVERDWVTCSLGSICEPRRGITYSSAMLESESNGLPYINMKSFLKGGGFNKDGTKHYAGFHTSNDLVGDQDLLIANTDVTAGDIVGVPALLPSELRSEKILYSHHVTRLRLNGTVTVPFLYYLLCLPEYRSWMLKFARGTTVLMLDMAAIKRIPVRAPKDTVLQHRITEILSTVDEAIEQTEALIAKYQQIKAGMMQDLFTRGVTPDGKLRPTRTEAPELYREQPLGWIPKEWEVHSLSAIAESLVDGPFGSNVKTEHYVVEPGVRVVRLQNIVEGSYNDADRAFVSQQHADYLGRNKVNPGDVLIAALGEDSYPVGRACCYPKGLPPAINKADCYRLRCKTRFALNAFVMHFLNTEAARKQVRRFEQGVTRRRTNLGNFRRVVVAVPKIDEQNRIVELIAAASRSIELAETLVKKVFLKKRGLMDDLLTGKVRVKGEEPT